MGVGAIASNLAAETYHLEILASEIQTINENATRFFILNNSNPDKSIVANKASIKFVANNDAGSLAEVLSIMAKQGLNLTKIQSMPIIDTPWKYAFFVDFIFNDYSLYSSAMEEIKDKVVTLKILGEYTKSKR
jgi:prephenate dehydratase